jgi:hypothetical protein
MQVRRVPASQGWTWVTGGFALLRRHPLALLGITVLFLFTIIVPTVLPLIGGFAPLLLTPALSVGYMQAVRTAESGRMPVPWTLYDGLRSKNPRRAGPLLVLGLINCVTTVAVLALTMVADGGTLFRLATGSIAADDPALGEGTLAYAAIVFLLLYAPVQMAMWYAPVFVAWHGLHPVRAMFYSLVGVWRNKAAFIVYMLAWFGVAVAVSIVLQLLQAVVPAGIMTLLLSPLSLVMLAALYCSFWPSYRDVVVDGPDADAPAGHTLPDAPA